VNQVVSPVFISLSERILLRGCTRSLAGQDTYVCVYVCMYVYILVYTHIYIICAMPSDFTRRCSDCQSAYMPHAQDAVESKASPTRAVRVQVRGQELRALLPWRSIPADCAELALGHSNRRQVLFAKIPTRRWADVVWTAYAHTFPLC